MAGKPVGPGGWQASDRSAQHVPSAPPGDPAPGPWYAHPLFIASTVVCCAPFGLILMWVFTSWKAQVKVAVSVIAFGFYALAMISAALAPPPQSTRVEATPPEPSVTSTERQPEPPPPTQETVREVPEPAEPATPAAISPACRDGEPLADVEDADDLRVIDECRTAGGTVTAVSRDGDSYRISLRPDDSSLVTTANVNGDLPVVVVAADRADCAELAGGTCTGANLTVPAEGDHLYVTGPYVYDATTGAMAIVPLWATSDVDPTTSSTTTTSSVPADTAPPTTIAQPEPTAAPTTSPKTTTAPAPTPTVPTADGPTAICNDGTYSYSQHRRGTCSHHGGVKVWLKDVPA